MGRKSESEEMTSRFKNKNRNHYYRQCTTIWESLTTQDTSNVDQESRVQGEPKVPRTLLRYSKKAKKLTDNQYHQQQKCSWCSPL